MSLKAEHWIALGAILAFSSVLGHGFVYDDGWTIVENRWLDRPFGELAGLLASGEALAKGVPDATRPTMVLSLWLDRRLFGASPVGPHLVSLLLYGGCCLLATLLAARLTRKRLVALVAGAFFALAPLHAEPVAAVNYREDLLSAAGVLGAWLCALGRIESSEGRAESWRRPGLAAAAWAVALFAKESAVVLVPLLALTGVALPRERRHVWRQQRLSFLLLLVGLSWALWRIPLAARGDDIPLAPTRGAGEVLLRSVRFFVHSVRHAFAPWDWAPDHWRQPDAGLVWLVPFVLLLAAMVALGRQRRGRVGALGLGIAMIAALPSSPLIGPVNEIADRYFFLGILGGGMVWGVAISLVARAVGLRGRRRALAALVCLPLAVPAWKATMPWRDERSLWTAAVDRAPTSPRAWAALSRVHRQAGEHALAATAIERAIRLDSGYPPALVTRVYNEISVGDLPRARGHLAELERLGLGGYRGVGKARRCSELELDAAKACVGR
jgi:hypothetical protein